MVIDPATFPSDTATKELPNTPAPDLSHTDDADLQALASAAVPPARCPKLMSRPPKAPP